MTRSKKATPNQTESYPVLDSHLRLLKLPSMLSEYPRIAKQCSSANATYEQYLEEMASVEIQKRDSNAIARRIKAAKVPSMKELSDFDFTSVPSLNKAKVLELARCSYIPTRTNVVVMGPPGVGKTHVAISLTLNACRHGYDARFFTAADMHRPARHRQGTANQSSVRFLGDDGRQSWTQVLKPLSESRILVRHGC